MTEYPVDIILSCGCTRVIAARPAYFFSRLGDQSTPREAERRMRCQTCRKRPRLSLSRRWSVSRPVELPGWMGL